MVIIRVAWFRFGFARFEDRVNTALQGGYRLKSLSLCHGFLGLRWVLTAELEKCHEVPA